MCGETHYFVDCSHETDVYVPCTWADDKYHRFLSHAKEGLCRSCNRDQLINALSGHCSNPREAATNMLKVIKEIRGKELPTPERVVNFLKTSKRAKTALQRMMAPQQLNWLADWLYSKKWTAPSIDASNCGRQDADIQKCLKKRRKRKSPICSVGSRELSTYNKGLGIDLNAHQDLPGQDANTRDDLPHLNRGSELDWASNLDSRPRRPKPKNLSVQDNDCMVAHSTPTIRPFSPVACGIATINAPQPRRPFQNTLNLDKISTLSSFHHHKVPKLDLPDTYHQRAQQLSTPTSTAPPTLRSQWDKNRYPTPEPKTRVINIPSASTASNSSHPALHVLKPRVPGIDIPFSSPVALPVAMPSTQAPEQELQIIHYVPVPVAVSRTKESGPGSVALMDERANVEVGAFEAFGGPQEVRYEIVGNGQE